MAAHLPLFNLMVKYWFYGRICLFPLVMNWKCKIYLEYKVISHKRFSVLIICDTQYTRSYLINCIPNYMGILILPFNRTGHTVEIICKVVSDIIGSCGRLTSYIC